jgi:predicted AAA+ superfamily ATPase
MVKRDCTSELRQAAAEYPVVTVLGPRQSGKTTLVRSLFPDKPYRSLEEPDWRALAFHDPRGFLADCPQGAVLDEIQRVPELLSYLQGVVDAKRPHGRFILTGSHQPELHRAVSQSLAGRTALLTLLPFSLGELRHYRPSWDPFELMVMGAFPRLHEEGLKPERFFNGYIQTCLERDVRSLINLKDLRRFQQFLVLLAGRVGQLLNYTSLANDVGVSSTTIKDWISVLVASFVVFELPPYHENLTKRVVKSPKIYFTDTGLAAHLVGIRNAEQAARDPLRGSLYENLLIADLLKRRLNQGRTPDLFFYRDTNGNEVDLIVREGRSLIPIEIKSGATFNDEFYKGIARFRVTAGDRVLPGAILYNGTQRFSFHDTLVTNLLRFPGDDVSAMTSPKALPAPRN